MYYFFILLKDINISSQKVMTSKFNVKNCIESIVICIYFKRSVEISKEKSNTIVVFLYKILEDYLKININFINKINNDTNNYNFL
jgi:hypothetical protein